MDITKKYQKMCMQAVKQTDIGEKWRALPQIQRLGTFVCFRSFVGMIVNTPKREIDDLMNILPETLAMRTWGDIEREDFKIIKTGFDFDDMGFPLFRQDQLQEIITILTDFEWYLLPDMLEEFKMHFFSALDIWADSREQFLLSFLMWKHYHMLWSNEKETWVGEVYLLYKMGLEDLLED